MKVVVACAGDKMDRQKEDVLARLVAAALIAWLLPSYAVVAAMAIIDGPGVFEAGMLLYGPLMGLFLGWPCFLFGGAVWGLLHRAGKVRPIYAALTGAAAPLLPIGYFVITMRKMFDDITDIISIPLALSIVAIGAVTGLVIWRVAYPRTLAID